MSPAIAASPTTATPTVRPMENFGLSTVVVLLAWVCEGAGVVHRCHILPHRTVFRRSLTAYTKRQ